MDYNRINYFLDEVAQDMIKDVSETEIEENPTQVAA